MNTKKTLLSFGVFAACVLGALASSSRTIGANPFQSLSVNHARDRIAKLAGLADLKKDQVRIKSLDIGLGGKDAVVVAQVETAFKLTRAGSNWEITEVRVGPGQWESIDLVREAIAREKTRRTEEDLQTLKAAAVAYLHANGQQVAARTIAELDDLLSPQFVERVIRFDYWGRELRIEASPQGRRIISAGPDGRFGTQDDIHEALDRD